MKKKVLDYLRYHHFNTNPAKESHSSFIDVLGVLEGFYGMRLGEQWTVWQSWEEIKEALNKCSIDQLQQIADRIERLKNEKRGMR